MGIYRGKPAAVSLTFSEQFPIASGETIGDSCIGRQKSVELFGIGVVFGVSRQGEYAQLFGMSNGVKDAHVRAHGAQLFVITKPSSYSEQLFAIVFL